MIDLDKLFKLNSQEESRPSERLNYTYSKGFMPWFVDYRSGNKTYEPHLKGMTDNNLTEDEAFMLLAYTSSYSEWINLEPRNGKAFEGEDKILYADYLSYVLEKLPAYNERTVYRMETWVYDEEKELKWFNKMVGKTFTLPYFLSTAKHDYENTTVVWEIKTLESNSRARDISNITNNKHEQEVLFIRNSKFKVRAVNKKKNYIYLDEVCCNSKADFALTGVYCSNIK